MKSKVIDKQAISFSELSLDKIEVVKKDTVQNGLKRAFQSKAGLPQVDRVSSLSRQSQNIIKILTR